MPSSAIPSNYSTDRPNVILIMTDDQGYGDLSCHGNPIIRTPNLDRLHAKSVRLTNFHVDPTCSPTRSALMTGRYSHRVKVWHTIMGRNYLRRGETTVAEVFKQSGYRTGHFGKWHLGGEYPYRPIDRGFDAWVGHGDGGTGTANDYWGNDKFNDTYQRNGEWEKFKGFCTDIYFNETMKFIKSVKGDPFFVYLATNVPHTPWNVPKELVDPYRGKTDVATACFFASISRMDTNLGRLQQFLRNEGLDRNTILVYLTDNGTSGGANVFNAGMRSTKGSVYDGGHRVPCFIHWPDGGIEAGKDVDHVTAHIDLLPTLIELCHLKKPRDVALDGTSLVPLLMDPAAPWPSRTLVVESQRIPHPEKWRHFAVMTDRWRLVNGQELYDLPIDPGQKRNVAKEHPETVKRLRDVYEAYWQEVSQRDRDHYNRVVIGSPQQAETLLCSEDWLPTSGDFAWSQAHVLKGIQGNGFWTVEFAHEGKYRFELRRWPREADAPVTSGSVSPQPDDNVGLHEEYTHPDYTPVQTGKGRAIPIHTARLMIDGREWDKAVAPASKAVVFDVQVTSGPGTVQSLFMGKDGEALCGAYYVYVSLLSY